MKIIRNSLVAAVAFLLLHYAFVRKYADGNYSAQQQWQGNRIKAEDFLYDNSHPDYPVIVGSSLVALLDKDTLRNFYNLGFSAQSIYDGFACVKKKNVFPPYIFIETNMFLHTEDIDFTSSILSTLPFLFRKHVYSFRDRYQPVTILGSTLVLPFVTSMLSPAKSNSNKSGNPFSGGSKTSNFFQKMIAEHLKQEGAIPSDAEINKCLKSLHKWVDFFEKNNVTVVFFEMPVDEQLQKSPGVMRIKQTLMESFPQTSYLYLPNPDGLSLQTVDGKHLDAKSGTIYSGYFKREALKIMNAHK